MTNISIPWRIKKEFGPDYISIKELSSGLEVNYNCPYCISRGKSPDTKGHLFVNLQSGVYHCYRCDAAGIIYKDEHNDHSHSIADLNIQLLNGIKLCNNKLSDISTIENSIKLQIPNESILSNIYAMEYMTSRGFSESLLVSRDVRVGNIFNKLNGRVVVPNRVEDRVWTDMYSARSYLGHDRKYLNPTIKKSNIVYNLHRIPDDPEFIIIVEGVLTAMRAGDYAVATYGHSCSKSQMYQILRKRPKRIYVNYDKDAYLESLELCDKLYQNVSVPIYHVVMPDDRDAADYEYKDYISIVQSSQLYQPNYDKLNSILKTLI